VGKPPRLKNRGGSFLMNANAPTKLNRPLHWFAVATAVATFLLLGAGGLVTSHEAGMSVPDWPNSYGYNMFAFPISKWTGGIFYEHTHRLWASVVGLMTYVLVLWIFGKKSRPFMRRSGFILPLIGIASELLFPNRPLDGVLYGAAGFVSYVASFFWPRCEWSVKWLRWLGIAAFLGVVAQGVLGGLRVTMKMDSLGIFHGVIAQTFFVLTCAIALFTSRFWQNVAQASRLRSGEKFAGGTPALRSLRSHVLFVTILIFLQLVLGATMRHQHAGLAISDFPLAHGKIWPDTNPDAIARYNAQRMEATNVNPITAFQVVLQMFHRIAALVIFAGVAAAVGLSVKRLGKKDSLTKLAIFWFALIILQIALGIATIWTNKAADVATAHVLVGALSLVTGALWCIIAFGRSLRTATIDFQSDVAITAFGTFAANK
jgi:cytochrome c oxidase assembly protein subunit 15